ncbi:DUF983 domain-containing protein [Methylorubrum salsuginis]|uniref:Uncharacterized conserved protein, DUF983 family n=1 Tax=Methylorubrum salsuginis TaxID=414703 RepID=A0A1I4BAC4_9HYPH|nr:DUF983 domain-containing protein [Methylorubrum salsuginis]SFK64949.1 Uncharacterized conserved protein, DUF983 family [Methylorubrum salsuginis]
MTIEAFPPPDAAAATRTRLAPAMARGFLNRCPHCGKGKLFGRFLKVRPECEACGLSMEGHRADDLPPYLVIFIVGHIVGYLVLKVESGYDEPLLPLWLSCTVFLLLSLIMGLGLLQPVKGAVIGLQYAFGMHGFGVAPPVLGVRGKHGGEAGTRTGNAPGLGNA